MGHAIVERVFLFGTRSADYIRASGHSGCIAMEVTLQAKTGRIHDRTRTLRRKVRFALATRAPSIHDPLASFRSRQLTQCKRFIRLMSATSRQIRSLAGRERALLIWFSLLRRR